MTRFFSLALFTNTKEHSNTHSSTRQIYHHCAPGWWKTKQHFYLNNSFQYFKHLFLQWALSNQTTLLLTNYNIWPNSRTEISQEFLCQTFHLYLHLLSELPWDTATSKKLASANCESRNIKICITGTIMLRIIRVLFVFISLFVLKWLLNNYELQV